MRQVLSHRLARVKPSATLGIASRTAKLKSLGHDIISLGVGEPDFDTPQAIKDAGMAAIQQGFTKYTAVEGIYPLRQAIRDKFQNDNQLEYQTDQILVSNGAKQSFYNLAQAFINPGDEVIIPAPYWVSYVDMVLLAEGEPVIIATTAEQRFKLDAEALKAHITPRTRMLVLNSPSNPSGMSYQAAELEALASVLLDYPDILIVCDDMYEHIRWSGRHVNLPMVCKALSARCIVINGVSKTYAMTGWRIGYAAGPTWLIKAMTDIQSQSTSNPCSISQRAALSALTMDQSSVHSMVKVYQERHDYVVTALNAIAGLRALPGDGTFYIFVDARQAIQTLELETDAAMAEHLLKHAGVAWVPGDAFGMAGYARLSFAASMAHLEEAMQRLQKCLGAKT